MDKPLSQERLRPKELEEIERQAYMNSISSRPDLRYAIGPEVMKLVDEVKRLQAIEAERDRYKAAFDYSVTNLAAYGLKQASAQAMKMLEGVNDHE